MSNNIEQGTDRQRNPAYLLVGYGIAFLSSCATVHYFVFEDAPLFDRFAQGGLAAFWTVVAAAHNHYEANLHKE